MALRHGQFSLAGAQAKVALFREGERWGRPSGRIPTTHILKPAVQGLDDHDLNEHLCLEAARIAGLRVAGSEVISFGGERAIAVERYDRTSLDGRLLRVHQEDVCQALGVLPTKKYQSEGGPSPAQVVRLLRDSDPLVASTSVLAFVDALALNWLIAGTDAHAKNYSLLLSGRQVRLAPLYDVASVLPYDDVDIREMRLAMSVGGEYRLELVSGRHWRKLAKQIRLDGDTLVGRVWDLAERLPDAFARAGSERSVGDLKSSLPERLQNAVTNRVTECLRLLEAG
jgi:serine/threonine-protein kinase HipA